MPLMRYNIISYSALDRKLLNTAARPWNRSCGRWRSIPGAKKPPLSAARPLRSCSLTEAILCDRPNILTAGHFDAPVREGETALAPQATCGRRSVHTSGLPSGGEPGGQPSKLSILSSVELRYSATMHFGEYASVIAAPFSYLTNGQPPSFSGRNAWSTGTSASSL